RIEAPTETGNLSVSSNGFSEFGFSEITFWNDLRRRDTLHAGCQLTEGKCAMEWRLNKAVNFGLEIAPAKCLLTNSPSCTSMPSVHSNVSSSNEVSIWL